jgi:antitoxin (DNA-binding transcriptional repressor) of toxin-antitoxin stability system
MRNVHYEDLARELDSIIADVKAGNTVAVTENANTLATFGPLKKRDHHRHADEVAIADIVARFEQICADVKDEVVVHVMEDGEAVAEFLPVKRSDDDEVREVAVAPNPEISDVVFTHGGIEKVLPHEFQTGD